MPGMITSNDVPSKYQKYDKSVPCKVIECRWNRFGYCQDQDEQRCE